MPIHEYVCNDCSSTFELIVRHARQSDDARCPQCDSASLARQLSVFAVGNGHSTPTDMVGACGTCGDPRGPGACSLN